jgi:hypothetical protein
VSRFSSQGRTPRDLISSGRLYLLKFPEPLKAQPPAGDQVSIHEPVRNISNSNHYSHLYYIKINEQILTYVSRIYNNGFCEFINEDKSKGQ